MNEQELAIEWLKRDEGLRLHPYECTANKITIGYGRNLEDCGITVEEAEVMLVNDHSLAREDASRYVGVDAYSYLSDVRKAVLTCMAFNLGLTRLSQFSKLKQAILDNDFEEAGKQMLDSRWATQVGQRANRLSAAMVKGVL